MNLNLTFPHRVNNAQNLEISKKNLDVLLYAKKEDELATPVAKQAFKEYQNAKLGLGHTIKTYTLATLPYGAGIAGVIGGLGLFGWWGISKVIENSPGLKETLETAFNEETIGGAAGSTSYLSNLPVVGSAFSALATTFGAVKLVPALAMGVVNTVGWPATKTLLVMGGFDAAVYTILGITPIKWFLGGAISMAGLGVLQGLNRISDILSKGCRDIEKASTKSREEKHLLILTQLKTTIDDVADAFFKLCDEAKDSPKQLLELKKTADQLHDRFSFIESQLAKYDLKPSDINQIMDKLFSVVNQVQEAAMDLRTPKSEADNRYNTEMLSVIPDENFEAVSKEVSKHVDIAHANTLGAMHTVKSYFNAGLSGLGAAAVAEVAFSALLAVGAYYAFPGTLKIAECAAAKTFSACKIAAGLLGAAAIPALALGSTVAKNLYDTSVKEKTAAEAKKNEHIEIASSKAKRIFDGIACDLLSRAEVLPKNDNKEFKKEIKNILAMMPSIKAQIAKTRVINPQVVTNELEIVLNKFA